jgi:hypothetical protein
MSESSARRLRSAGARPNMSIVVAWQGCPSELSRRLRAWDRWVDNGVDVVVVCACSTAEQQRIERAHPGVRVVAGNPVHDLRELREIGVSAARGDIVVIFDDTMGRTSSWREHLPPAIDGTPASGPVADWGSFEGVTRPLDDSVRR